jgi:hypothetical protein
MVVIGGARSCPGLQWKWVDASSNGALVVYRARTVLLASSKRPRLQLQAYSPHPQRQVGGLSCQCGSKRRSFWFCRNLGLTIHSSRTRFVASRLRLTSRAGRLNSGVRHHWRVLMKVSFLCLFIIVVSAPALVQARGHSSGGSYHAYRPSYSRPFTTSSYKPQRVYSCANCNMSDHYVAPTIRRNGESVTGHMQSDSNATRTDNFTHDGNTNPYTGDPGTKH